MHNVRQYLVYFVYLDLFIMYLLSNILAVQYKNLAPQ